MSEVYLYLNVDLENLATELATSGDVSDDELIKFILQIDQIAFDVETTKKLIKKLKKVVKENDDL